jgi:hypothetical protein
MNTDYIKKNKEECDMKRGYGRIEKNGGDCHKMTK